ncbi:MAG: MBL fold metallo-hydrolase [Firmicutes bacterium]|nr:MBL fold metallo-hydrolase [Bacillota bacterium]
MKITFCGAVGTVTGSCFLIETARHRFIVDCGMFQGNKEIRSLNEREFLFNPVDLDFVLLTHAHIDHSGLIPKLVKNGFSKKIFATKATVELCRIMLPDSGHIQEMEQEWRNRKRARKGQPLLEPLYTSLDAQNSLKYFQPINYQEEFRPVPEVTVRFLDAGHILGSAIIEIYITEKGATTKLVCSGDLGQMNQPIIKDPTYVRDADYILIESTYGNRLHEDSEERVRQLQRLIIDSVETGGNLIIPAFAVGRTQDLLYHIRTLLLKGEIPRIPVYIDSPMAVSVTEIYRDSPGYYDEPTLQMLADNQSPFDYNNLHYIRTVDESRRLNKIAKGAIIISASGMCEAGRILHHLKHNLWRPESHILFVGYQAEGTLGRRLLEGVKVVKIMGEEIGVRAQVHSIGGFSAHADQAGLMDWLGTFEKTPRGIFITHGESGAQKELADLIRRNIGLKTTIPAWGEKYELNAAAHRQQQLQPAMASFVLDRTVTDLEHSVLNLRRQIEDNSLDKTGAQLTDIRRLIAELEGLLS